MIGVCIVRILQASKIAKSILFSLINEYTVTIACVSVCVCAQLETRKHRSDSHHIHH